MFVEPHHGVFTLDFEFNPEYDLGVPFHFDRLDQTFHLNTLDDFMEGQPSPNGRVPTYDALLLCASRPVQHDCIDTKYFSLIEKSQNILTKFSVSGNQTQFGVS